MSELRQQLPQKMGRSFITMLILLVVTFLIGYVVVDYAIKSSALSQEDFLGYVEEFMKQVGLGPSSTQTEIFIRILMNNARIAFISLALGLIPFLRVPGLIIIINGFALGSAVRSFVAFLGMDAQTIIRALLPHGIIELPAICLSAGLGILLCKAITQKVRGRSQEPFAELLLPYVKAFVLVVVPLLIIAAFIETYITPLIAVGL